MMKPFDPLHISLTGDNLIEASAGTGKTYSVALLAIRFIVEKEVPLQQLLMVTFTKAAVAELEARVRHFVREAHRYSCGHPIADSALRYIVDRAVQEKGHKVKDLLYSATLFLDETAILTIHGFCQLVLKEFAFETNQLFGVEISEQETDLQEFLLNEYWRKNISVLSVDALRLLLKNGLSRSTLGKVVKFQAEDKPFVSTLTVAVPQWPNKEAINQWATAGLSKLQACKQAAVQRIEAEQEAVERAVAANAYARKSAIASFRTAQEHVDYYFTNPTPPQYLHKIYACIEPDTVQYKALTKALSQQAQAVVEAICADVAAKINEVIAWQKAKRNTITFDDIIHQLHRAVMGPQKELLRTLLQQKYWAVFIDEFQDTDRIQYEIFSTAFNASSVVFYIGDPKQSIYGWRKADIDTYLQATQAVAATYTMEVNYRSSADYIQALNSFYLPAPHFDAFHNPVFKYLSVKHAPDHAFKHLIDHGNPQAGIEMVDANDKAEIALALSAEVQRLLYQPQVFIQKNAVDSVAVKPADIGILVRSNRDAQLLKDTLAQKGIKAITVDDTKLLQTPEVPYVLYLLEAIYQPSRSNINKALLSPFLSYHVVDLLQLDEQQVLGQFADYLQVWNRDGILPVLNRFAAEHDLRGYLLNEKTANGGRLLANFLQMAELLHHIEMQKALAPNELISWLSRALEGASPAGDQYEQRIESDENAVQIMTIHKSKGLQFPIVFVPYLDVQPKVKPIRADGIVTFSDVVSFKDEAEQFRSTFFAGLKADQQAHYTDLERQENRRLLYVAMTRAVYKCYLFHQQAEIESTLHPFFEALPTGALPHLKRTSVDTLLAHASNAMQAVNLQASTSTSKWMVPLQAQRFYLKGMHWKKVSYTSLAGNHAYAQRAEGEAVNTAYDQFIFHELAKGVRTGNLVHAIMQNIDLQANETWARTIHLQLRRQYPSKIEAYSSGIAALLANVLHTPLAPHAFSLSEVPASNLVNEIEFDKRLPLFNVPDLLSLSTPECTIQIGEQSDYLEGLLNGKVDLFFEHQGQYFIVDYKTNHLGNSLENYRQASLADAMNENNYHLQYLIYTLAMLIYVQQQKPDFDYETQFGGVYYLFVRGMRNDQSAGIYYTKPPLSQIKQLAAILGVEIGQ